LTLCKCDASQLQCGDQILIRGEIKTVVAIEGPDRIGTYDVFVQDAQGNKSQEIILETITLAR
jgi:hypothetical protein